MFFDPKIIFPQDNGPLMRALAKLIAVNDPDLVLFVGEALVGNEAVDQVILLPKLTCEGFHTSVTNLLLLLDQKYTVMILIQWGSELQTSPVQWGSEIRTSLYF